MLIFKSFNNIITKNNNNNIMLRTKFHKLIIISLVSVPLNHSDMCQLYIIFK